MASWSLVLVLVITIVSFAVVARLATRFPHLHRHPAQTLLWILACLAAATILQLCSRHDDHDIVPTLALLFLTARTLWYATLARDLAVASANPCFKFKPGACMWPHAFVWTVSCAYAFLSTNKLLGALSMRLVHILPTLAVLAFVAVTGFVVWRRVKRDPGFQAHITTERLIRITTQCLKLFAWSGGVASVLSLVPASPTTTSFEQLALAGEAFYLCVLFCRDANFKRLLAQNDPRYVCTSEWHRERREAEEEALPLGRERWLGEWRSTVYMALMCAYRPDDFGNGSSDIEAYTRPATAADCAKTNDLSIIRHEESVSWVIGITCLAPRVFKREMRRCGVDRAVLHAQLGALRQELSMGLGGNLLSMSFSLAGEGTVSVQYLASPHAVSRLLALLPAYTSYLAAARHSLLCRYIDLLSLSVPLYTRRIGVAVMFNGFRRPRYLVHHTLSGAHANDASHAQQETIAIDASAAHRVLAQLREDCAFLAEQGVTGYRFVVLCKHPRDGPDMDDGGIPSLNPYRPGKYQFRIVDLHRKRRRRLAVCMSNEPKLYADRLQARVEELLRGEPTVVSRESLKLVMNDSTETENREPPSPASSEATISIRGSSCPFLGVV